jgi:hypothetical protein
MPLPTSLLAVLRFVAVSAHCRPQKRGHGRYAPAQSDGQRGRITPSRCWPKVDDVGTIRWSADPLARD